MSQWTVEVTHTETIWSVMEVLSVVDIPGLDWHRDTVRETWRRIIFVITVPEEGDDALQDVLNELVEEYGQRVKITGAPL